MSSIKGGGSVDAVINHVTHLTNVSGIYGVDDGMFRFRRENHMIADMSCFPNGVFIPHNKMAEEIFLFLQENAPRQAGAFRTGQVVGTIPAEKPRGGF